jgi:tRNA A-37 threonylcarbamoyl transferase component Bud32
MDTGAPSGHLQPDARRLLPAGFRSLFEVQPAAPLRAVPGRETFLWPEQGPATLVIKRHVGDLGRDRWFDRLHGHGGRSPGRREYENLGSLAKLGFPVPESLGWAEWGSRSLVVMVRVPHDETLLDVSQRVRGLGGRARLVELVELVARLHGAGWYHRDLYLQHLLIGDRGLVLIDVGRARRQPRPRRRWFLKDLGALLHSTPAEVPQVTRLRFLAAYLNARGVLDRAARRRWARAAAARARRIGAHRPRYEYGGGPA